jgi:soluble lytic murein transglycosylase-like protein
MPQPPLYPNETLELRGLINQYADLYEVPRGLVHRVVARESTHRPEALNRPYYGLMQILPATARSMGFRGEPADLLDAETNLKYAVKYLRGAWLLSDGSYDTAVQHYSRGYYYEAKRRGMLVETGLKN